ncbi:MAG: VOC family protein [Caulobacteraceae bacterium]
MFNHLSLGVRDLGAAKRFYDAFFAPLGCAPSHANDKEVAYGPDGAAGLFWIYPVEGERVAGLGTHIAFSADTDEAVISAAAAAIANGASVVRAAGPHPDLAPDYFGAVLIDPDGNKLEVLTSSMH